MASLATRLFWAVPALRDVAATLKGLQLHRQRYGRLYHDTIAAIKTRDTWTRDALLAYQEEQLRRVVKYAVSHVPHYREVFKKRGLCADDIRTIRDLRKLPILEKHTLREDPQSLADDRKAQRRFIIERTSGTTGTPVCVYKTRESLQRNYAYYEVRHLRVAGLVFGKDPYAMLGVRQVAPADRTRPPFWCYNHLWKQLYMSVYHLSDRFLGDYCRELRRRPYVAIMGYPSPIYALARFILDTGEPRLRFKAALTTAETLFDDHRRVIEEAFGCRVYDQYGCTENCVFAAECSEGRMHISLDYGILEVVDQQGQLVQPGTTGDLVCTGLTSFDHVLIRYRIGDTGALSTSQCTCGSPLPVLERLEGRTDQLLITLDGRRVGRLGQVLKGVEHVKECQIVQDDYERFRIRVVPEVGYEKADGQQLIHNLRQHVGEVEVEIVLEDSIERTVAGKFQLTVCNLTPEQKAATLATHGETNR